MVRARDGDQNAAARTLKQLAEAAGFRAADVALLAGCDESTISRLWLDPFWLDRVSGRTLRELIAMVPAVADYVVSYSRQSRLDRLVGELAAEGLRVDVVAVAALPATRGVIPEHLLLALTAALHIMRQDSAGAASYLARLWGRRQDGALGAVFEAGPLADPAPLVAAAEALVPRLTRAGYSLNTMLARSQLVHQVSRVTARPVEVAWEARDLDRQAALVLRSSAMGALTQAEDPEPAQAYQALVRSHPVIRMVEEWAFPAWTGDCPPSRDMSLPGSLLLRRTAAEVIREIAVYGDGYVHYLVSTYLPLALSLDPTFGLRASDLRQALLVRRAAITHPLVGKTVDRLVRHLPAGDI
jgi:hypothetical protein